MSLAEKQTKKSPEGARFARALRRLPMFPLPNVVLFPNALLPLHIFEPRYQKLTRDVLASNKLLVMAQQVGQTHARAGSRHDELPAVAPVAGVGEIILANELPDGKFNLVLRGRARVRVEEELPSAEPYRLVSVTEIPDDPSADMPGLIEADESLRALVQGLADALPSGGELLKQVAAAQENPAALVDVLASTLVADPKARQLLLENTDVASRIERVSAEVVAMTSRIVPNNRLN